MNMAINTERISRTIHKIKTRTWFVMMLILITVFLLLQTTKTAEAAEITSENTVEKSYGIMIAAQSGSYTFYDMNDSTDGTAAIEMTESGNIMVPLKKLVKVIPDLTYRYDSVKKTATVTNRKNGKIIVYSKNSNKLLYYASSKSKVKSKTMVYKMYVSKASSSVMVHMNTLKWVMNSTDGYAYYKTDQMQTMGYDTEKYSGLLLYNPYNSAASLPKAANVTGISATVKVTIPEGYSVPQVFNLLVKKGVCASTDLLYDAMEHYDFSYYPLVAAIEANENRHFKLEGYLYPDTYEFYRLSKPQDVIGKFLRNAESKLTENIRQKALGMGYQVDELLTIASMIEKETGDYELMPSIASVIYNRLNIKMKIQFDSTYFYVNRYIEPYIDQDAGTYYSAYDTYQCVALPAGPICNPSMEAIQAALNPAVTDYLYFYSDDKGEYHFSAEHVNPKTLNESKDSNNENNAPINGTEDTTESTP